MKDFGEKPPSPQATGCSMHQRSKRCQKKGGKNKKNKTTTKLGKIHSEKSQLNQKYGRYLQPILPNLILDYNKVQYNTV